jgi:hypothetical protein
VNADEFNAHYPVGTRVAAYPITRDDKPLLTHTRSVAWTLGHGAAVVSVNGYTGGIALTHVDVIGGEPPATTVVFSPPRPVTGLPSAYRAAARLITHVGHHQGDYVRDPFDRELTTDHATRPMCVVAALRCVSSGNPHQSSPLSEAAVAFLARRLEVAGEGPADDAPRSLEAHVCAWGDVEGRRTETVAAVLEAAADAAEVIA